jgi:hypothetical protein
MDTYKPKKRRKRKQVKIRGMLERVRHPDSYSGDAIASRQQEG